MPINLEVNGVEYTNFVSAGVTIALDTLSNDFMFEATAVEGDPFPFKGGEPCTIVVDGELVLTGYIENITGVYTARSHTLIVTGRDKTMDLVDSSINVLDDIRGDAVTLKKLIEIVVAHIGMDVEVVDLVNPEPFNVAEDIMTPQPGTNSFQFVEGYAQKRHVLLTSNAEGDVVITDSKAIRSGAVLQNALKDSTNNIKEASWSYSSGKLFNRYIFKGQLDPIALDLGKSTSRDGLISQEANVVDGVIREGRQLVVVTEKGFSNDQLMDRALWSKNVRRGRSVSYACEAQGFRHTGDEIWQVNTLISVLDVFADIDRELLLNSVQFLYGASGSRSLLRFVEADTYELTLNEPTKVGSNQDTFVP